MIATYIKKETGEEVYVQSFLETMTVMGEEDENETIPAVTFYFAKGDEGLQIMPKESFSKEFEKK